MLKTNSPVMEIAMKMADGSAVTLRRCGLLPDVFSSKSGKIYHLSSLTLYRQGNHRIIKYLRSSLMARHLVADAWLPGWESEGARLVPIDGDDRNISADNLAVKEEPGRGRPRDNAVYRRLLAVDIFRACQDLELTAEETGMTPAQLKAAIKAFAPELLDGNI